MTLFHAFILGIVEGITEYLPISSTFHLIWAAQFLGLQQTEFLKMFEVIIQTGAIASVVYLYFSTLLKERKLIKKILVSFIPTAVVGFVLYKIIKNVFFEQTMLQLIVFIFVGIVFIVYEKYKSKNVTKTISHLTYKEAILVGLAQSLAVVPGVSRAGAVILALLLLHVKREEAAKYSFLLAAPTLFAAGALDLMQSHDILTSQTNNISLLFVGFLASFFSALIVIKWFIKYLQHHDLTVFGWYRIGVGLILLLLGRS